MVWPPDSPWAPWWKTSKNKARILWKLGEVKKGDRVYELGSGNGTALIVAAREFDAECVGIEIDPIRIWYSRFFVMINRLSKKIKIFRKNFFEVDLSDATVVYAYLVPKTLERLKQKFLKELKPGTRVLSYHYPITYLPLVASDKKNEMYLYEVPKKREKKHVISSTEV